MTAKQQAAEIPPWAAMLLAPVGTSFAGTSRPLEKIQAGAGVESIYGLPGGKVDPGETPLQTVLREAVEEGWDPEDVDPEPIHKAMDLPGFKFKNAPVWWYRARSAKMRDDYKERDRLKPLLLSIADLKRKKSTGEYEMLKKYFAKMKAEKTSSFHRKTAAWLLKEAEVTLDINKGDILLGGKYKNSPITVEEIGTDELGQPTVNGRKLLAYRIKKKMPEKTASGYRQLLRGAKGAFNKFLAPGDDAARVGHVMPPPLTQRTGRFDRLHSEPAVTDVSTGGKLLDYGNRRGAPGNLRFRRLPPTWRGMEKAITVIPEKTAAPKHVVVMGASGAGKSTKARELAELLKRSLLQTDTDPRFRALAAKDPNGWAAGKINPDTAQAAAARRLLKTKTPSVLEGTGFLMLDPKELAGHETYLVDPSREEVLKRRLQRWLAKPKNKDLKVTPELIAERNAIGGSLYDRMAPLIEKFREHATHKTAMNNEELHALIEACKVAARARAAKAALAPKSPGIAEILKKTFRAPKPKLPSAEHDSANMSKITGLSPHGASGGHFGD